MNKPKFIKFFFGVIICVSSLNVNAQTELSNDSIPKELDEVVVEAQLQRNFVSRTDYVPTKRQKSAAQNAIELLRQMAIPQIQINPVTEVITNSAGEQVYIFINYTEASKEEIEGFRADDVRKVEFLEFPTDPRFNGAKYVINILIHEYEYGGYTKMTVNENFLIGLSSRINVFAKFSCKKMTYDLYVGSNNWNNHHNGNDIEGVYSLKDDNNRIFTLNRKETLSNSHFKQNQYPVTFRATYNSSKVHIRNLLAYMHQDIPTFTQNGNLVYSPKSDNDYTFQRLNTSHNNFFVYQGSYYCILPKQFSMEFSPSFNYTHSVDNLRYSTSKSPQIIRMAHENAFNYKINAYVRKNIGAKHTVVFGISGGDNINKLNYSGSSIYHDRFNNPFVSGKLGYNFHTQHLNFYVDAGGGWEGNDINGHEYNCVYPLVNLSFRYSPNVKHSLSGSLQYTTGKPGLTQKSSDILQENEYMYITGNPHLKNSRNISTNFSYSWMPSNIFSLSAFGNYLKYFNRQMMIYESFDNGHSLLRSYTNSGNYAKSELGITALYRPMNGKLQISVSPRQSFYKSTGIYARSYNQFSVSANITYYLNNIYVQGYYQSPQKSMLPTSPQIHKDHNFHSLTVGWANSDWNVRFMAANIFNRGWHCSQTILSTPLYTEHKYIVGNSLHPRINITATYTFCYGKRINKGNEIGEQYSGTASAILK